MSAPLHQRLRRIGRILDATGSALNSEDMTASVAVDVIDFVRDVVLEIAEEVKQSEAPEVGA